MNEPHVEVDDSRFVPRNAAVAVTALAFVAFGLGAVFVILILAQVVIHEFELPISVTAWLLWMLAGLLLHLRMINRKNLSAAILLTLPIGIAGLVHFAGEMFWVYLLLGSTTHLVFRGILECNRAGMRLSSPAWWFRRRLAAQKCPGCLYDIRSLPSPRCPECGLDLNYEPSEA